MLLEINHLTFSAGHFQNEIICFGLLILKRKRLLNILYREDEWAPMAEYLGQFGDPLTNGHASSDSAADQPKHHAEANAR